MDNKVKATNKAKGSQKSMVKSMPMADAKVSGNNKAAGMKAGVSKPAIKQAKVCGDKAGK